jgi:Tol biopolymer transport system component
MGIWSSDGSRIIFPYGDGAHYDLYQKSGSGVKDQELLLKSDEPKLPRSCSPDGRFLLYSMLNIKTRTRELWVLPFEGDKKPIPFATQFNNFEGQFSPDSRWVAYVSDESGREEVYVRTFSPDSEGEGKWIISIGGGLEPRWSPDGKTLYYIALDGKLMAVAITANDAFRAGVPKALFQIAAFTGGPFRQSWCVAPDGKRFLFAIPSEQRTAAFEVVVNWQAGLKKP